MAWFPPGNQAHGRANPCLAFAGSDKGMDTAGCPPQGKACDLSARRRRRGSCVGVIGAGLVRVLVVSGEVVAFGGEGLCANNQSPGLSQSAVALGALQHWKPQWLALGSAMELLLAFQREATPAFMPILFRVRHNAIWMCTILHLSMQPPLHGLSQGRQAHFESPSAGCLRRRGATSILFRTEANSGN